MKTQSKQPAKKASAKGRTGTEKTAAPKTKKTQETDMDQDEDDFESTTPDPTKPDTETSYHKKHKIGFKK